MQGKGSNQEIDSTATKARMYRDHEWRIWKFNQTNDIFYQDDQDRFGDIEENEIKDIRNPLQREEKWCKKNNPNLFFTAKT